MTEHPAYATLRPVTRYASVLLARNPSPMTLEGTNTWVVGEPGATGRAVIDPGPEDADHLRRVADHGPVSLVLLTHHHGDHTDGVERFAELTGAPVRALDPALCRDAEPLRDGEVVEAGGVELRVLATPGHTADSVCFAVEHDEPAVFTGDSVLGRGTTVVAHPDGHLGSYLESLRRLADLPEGLRVLPGHGPELPDVRAIATHYLQHRHQRLDQVRAALADLGPDATPRQVVELVYADVDRSVWPAADLTVRAQLTYLRETA
ncbi:MBL fold metallo-hydrolase [Saccharopolyspora hirsuta]|uniref:MBL fold metallo-hydrolase n=1 Tax=Saccharopolyspora hirsuta TaxID=1837 RepID=A0A5M7C1W6_SACHI|nr:MBL fold metallo-hydrolase [Saccharopolyspora hirsuta]KAA5835932.1 MBL fold metallo-hydrolase [Saccharopolyspora hirsuta]